MTQTPNTVVKTSHLILFSDRRNESIPGVALLMSDGALWFHPSNGDAPWQFGWHHGTHADAIEHKDLNP